MRFLLALVLSFGFFPFAQAQTVNGYPWNNYAGKMTTVSATIASSATTSAAIPLNGFSVVGIAFPAAFTGTTVTFTGSATAGGTYLPIYNASGQVSYTIAQGRYYAIASSDLDGIQFLKIVSGSTEGGARTLVVSIKGKQ